MKSLYWLALLVYLYVVFKLSSGFGEYSVLQGPDITEQYLSRGAVKISLSVGFSSDLQILWMKNRIIKDYMYVV